MINDLMTEVTDINEYERILKLEEYNEMLYQFPSELPESYISVKYFYRPQFLQGSMRMELLLELNENEVNSYIEIYENNCKQIINVKEWSSNELNNIGIITVGIDVFNDEIKEDFIIYLLDSKPYEENNWNHGYAIFIAVNNEKNKILFQSEVW